MKEQMIDKMIDKMIDINFWAPEYLYSRFA